MGGNRVQERQSLWLLNKGKQHAYLGIQVNMDGLGVQVLLDCVQTALSAITTLLPAAPRCLLGGVVRAVD